MYKQNSEFKSIQKKLVGAVAMVLVACIMVVSSSYAWFTLSTAPEVTGIQTSVGSNGNLEMALRDNQYDLNSIPTGSQVSMPDANMYWGNLVNLEDASYGLSEIALKPSRLSWSNANGNKINDAYITVPTYGTDGRISGWLSGLSGKLTNNQWLVGDYVGVRGIGTVSGLTAGQIALRNAVSTVTNNRDIVIGAARNSLEVDAINLANLMIASQIGGKTTATAAEWAQVVAAVGHLEDIATNLLETMDSVVEAVAVSKNVDIAGKTISYSAAGATVADVTLEIPAALQTGLGAAYTTLTSINDKLDDANDVIDGTDTSNVPFTAVEDVMDAILDKDDIQIINTDGTPITLTGKTVEELAPILMEANSNGKLPMNIIDGIYTEIADFVGTYSAQKKTTFDVSGYSQIGSLFPNGVPVNLQMKVETPAPTATGAYYMAYFVTQLNLLEAHDTSNSTEQIISDLYAFAVDMAFRTNAASSNLLLQTAEALRVSGDTTAATQGGGSYMEFTKGELDAGYTVEQMRRLMGAVRVVLYNTATNEIYAVAALDMAEATADATNPNKVKAPLYLHNFSMNDDQSLQLGAKKDTAAITALTQNVATGITAMVYLDGDLVGNDDVAVNGNSMSGTLNLQFASSATLKPMEYTFEAPANP